MLERDIAALTKEIGQNVLVERGKEAIRETINQKLHGSPIASPADTGGVIPTPVPQTNGPLPAYAKDAPPELKLKVEKLLDVALHKGIMVAVREAKNNDPAVMDMFHDAITERLYDEFKKRKIIT